MLIALDKARKIQIPFTLILKECANFAAVKICSKCKWKLPWHIERIEKGINNKKTMSS